MVAGSAGLLARGWMTPQGLGGLDKLWALFLQPKGADRGLGKSRWIRCNQVGPYSGHGCMGCGGHMPEFEVRPRGSCHGVGWTSMSKAGWVKASDGIWCWTSDGALYRPVWKLGQPQGSGPSSTRGLNCFEGAKHCYQGVQGSLGCASFRVDIAVPPF